MDLYEDEFYNSSEDPDYTPEDDEDESSEGGASNTELQETSRDEDSVSETKDYSSETGEIFLFEDSQTPPSFLN